MLTLFLLLAPPMVEIAPPPHPVDPFAKWEKDITAIEKRLAANPPKSGAVFFVGSSSIVKWDVEKSFPGAGYIKVGFGGSVIADSTHFANRILTPHKPGTIVFYAGDNDIGRGDKPEQLADNFKAFVATVRKDNPSCRILFISVKPSISRWKMLDKQTKANALVKAFCEKEKELVYVDVVPTMLGADGTPIPDLFVKDGLHMTPKGYEVWTAELKKVLMK